MIENDRKQQIIECNHNKIIHQNVFDVLWVFSDQVDAFDSAERQLLDELAVMAGTDMSAQLHGALRTREIINQWRGLLEAEAVAEKAALDVGVAGFQADFR